MPDAITQAEQRLDLAQAAAILSAREYTIIHARYHHGWTQAEVAEDLDICQQRLSYMENRALARLRREIRK
jgi:RNA polymerase sigma factor (sigma-70 family)